MPKKKATTRTPTHVNAFVISFRLPPHTTLGHVRTAILAVKKHLGGLCRELGGPNLARRTDVSISSSKGLFLMGTAAPEGVVVTWPEMDEPTFAGAAPEVPGTGPGTAKLRAEERARKRRPSSQAKAARRRPHRS